MEDILENKLICRICLKVVDQSTQSYGNIEDDTGTLRDMMLCCIPEMDIYVSANPILCFPCIQALVGLYNFKTKCINTETIIKTFMHRHNIAEFGNVNLTHVVRDLIELNNTQKQKQMKERMALEMQQIQNNSFRNKINTINETTRKTNEEESTISDKTLPDGYSQVRETRPEETDSYHSKITVSNMDSQMTEVTQNDKMEESLPVKVAYTHQNSSIHNPKDHSNSSLCSSESTVMNPVADENIENSLNTSSVISQTEILSQNPEITKSLSVENPSLNSDVIATISDIPASVSITSNTISETPNSFQEDSKPIFDTSQETTKFISDTTKPTFQLHRPFVDNIDNVSGCNTSKMSCNIQQSSQSRPISVASQENNTNITPSRPNSTASQNSSTTFSSQSNPPGPDQNDLDLFSPQLDPINLNSDNSPTDLKILDSEISQIIDQLGDDLAKEDNIFSQIDAQPPKQTPEVVQRQFQPYSQAEQFQPVNQYKSQMPSQQFNPLGNFPGQNWQQFLSMNNSQSEMRQTSPQLPQNSPYPVHNSHQLGNHFNQATINSNHLGFNRNDYNSQHFNINPHQPHMSQSSYHMRQYPSQMGVSFPQRNHPSEIAYHQQILRQPTQTPSHHSQLASQFPNISNHLRNSPQMGYVSSNMANALAQMGQVPPDYNQMSPQMRYLRMQLQLRHRSSPMGPPPPQYGQRPPHGESWYPHSQVKQWLPPGDSDSQRRFNSGLPQTSHELPHYRPPQLNHSTQIGQPPHPLLNRSPQPVYGSSQISEVPHLYGKQSYPVNHPHMQFNQTNSQSHNFQGSPQQIQHPQIQHYLNRGQFHRSSPSQSPGVMDIHQRSLQQTPTPPSRSPFDSLASQNRSHMFSPPTFDGFSAADISFRNEMIKKSDSPLSNCRSPHEDNWKVSPFNFRGTCSPTPRFVPPNINPQIRVPAQPMSQSQFVFNSENRIMPPPQTSFLPKDHLAQRMRFYCNTLRPENPQIDNYQSASDESIRSLLVDLPPIESPVVPLSVQIKSLHSSELIQQTVKECQEASEALSSVEKNNTADHTDETKEQTVVEQTLESDEKNEDSVSNVIGPDTNTFGKGVSSDEVVTISKDDIYRETDDDDEDSLMQNSSTDDNSLQNETTQNDTLQKMETDQNTSLNDPFENRKLPQQPTPNNVYSMNYQCFNCSFVTSSSEEFIQHRETCKDVKEKVEHKCPHCHYSTTRRYVLTQHINSQHTKEIWYQCPDCDYKCTDKSYLKRHSRIHAEGAEIDEKVCEYCDFRTLSEYNFRKHLSKHDIQVLQCEFCSYSTNDRTNFRRHLFTHNPVSSECDFCDYKSVSPYHMRNHLKKYHNGVGVEDLDLRKDQPIMELVDEIRAAVKDANQIRV